MKGVIFISAMDFNNNSAGSKRVASYSYALSPVVDRVYLISLYSILKNNKFLFECIKGNIYMSSRAKNSNRSFRSILNFLRSFKEFYKEHPNFKIIIYPSSFFIFDFTVIINLTIKKIPFFIELNEIRKYNLNFKKKIFKKKNLYHNFKYLFTYPLYILMDYLFRKASGHIYISSTIADYFKNKRFIIIPILCNSKPRNINNFKNYSKGELFKIGFAGTIDSYKERMTTFFQSLANITRSNPNILINLYGYMPHEEDFFNEIDQFEISKFIKYHGIVKKDLLIKRLKEENHLLILPRGYTKQNYYGFSTKLSEYLEAQLPILTSTIGDIGKYFIDLENSYTYKPDDVKSLTKKIEFIIDNYNLISPQIVKGGDALISDFFYFSNYSNILYNFLFENTGKESKFN